MRVGAAFARLRAWAAVADPVRVAIRCGFVLLALSAVAWDLPSSFSWENDGVAPRDIFAGVAENLRPGHAFRYPLLHPLLLGLLCLPVLLPAALRARSFDMAALRDAVLATPVMTTCALVGRAVAIAAAVIALAALGRVAARLWGVRVARWAEAFGAVNLSFAYYGRATNLDGPALMWTALAIERVVRACARGRHDAGGTDARPAQHDHLWFALFAALSVATKDQAYAAYVLVVPVLLVARPWPLRRLAAAAGLGALAYGAASGALFNPGGFVTRLRTLAGPASGDYRAYQQTAAGWLANLHDIAAAQPDLWWPWPVVVTGWLGVAITVLHVVIRTASARDPAAPQHDRAVRLLPLLAGLGSLVAFALVVGRYEHRFVLPLGFWLSIYAAVAIETIRRDWFAGSRIARRGLDLCGGALVGAGLVASIALVLTQWGDARRAVEDRLRRLPPGTSVETYGPLVYLPRFETATMQARAAPYHIRHVATGAVASRNPLAGMDEVQGDPGDVARRRPDVVLITEGFALPYLAQAPTGGRAFPPVWQRERAERPSAAPAGNAGLRARRRDRHAAGLSPVRRGRAAPAAWGRAPRTEANPRQHGRPRLVAGARRPPEHDRGSREGLRPRRFVGRTVRRKFGRRSPIIGGVTITASLK